MWPYVFLVSRAKGTIGIHVCVRPGFLIIILKNNLNIFCDFPCIVQNKICESVLFGQLYFVGFTISGLRLFSLFDCCLFISFGRM